MTGPTTVRTVGVMKSLVTHTDQYRRAQCRVLDGSDLGTRCIEVGAGHSVQLLERGHGDPLVFLHGTGSGAAFLQPLLERLEGVRVIAPDRPGQGLSAPIDVPQDDLRRGAVEWIGRLLDALAVDRVALAGHSMGGLWSLWYALECADRLSRLVLLAPPQLPGTRCPLPYRVMGTPGLFRLVQRLSPPSRRSSLQFAKMMGEGDTLVGRTELLDLMVAAADDPATVRTNVREARAIISPTALFTPSGFRRHMDVRADELRGVALPTLLVWGDREPLGPAELAHDVVQLMPDATAAIVPGGHAPWLGHPDLTAEVVNRFVHRSPN